MVLADHGGPACGGEWLARVIGAIGRGEFPTVLFEALSDGFGVDHVVVSTVRGRGQMGGELGIMAQAGRMAPRIAERLAHDYVDADWFRRDPNLPLVLATGPEVRTVNLAMIFGRYSREYRRRFFDASHIVDKVAISARIEDDRWLYANFHRLAESGPFGHAERHVLAQHGPLLAAALTRHHQLIRSAKSLDTSASHFKALTPRERDVCAAILRGLTLRGVAASLGVSFNTVLTLRRRAYARLGIATERELVRLSLAHS